MSKLQTLPEPEIVIQAAVLIDDHYDRLDFLNAWIDGDFDVLSEFQDELDRAAAR